MFLRGDKVPKVLARGPTVTGGCGSHLPLQPSSSLSSEQSRKPSQRSESTMQASPSSHLNSLLIHVKVLWVAETERMCSGCDWAQVGHI